MRWLADHPVLFFVAFFVATLPVPPLMRWISRRLRGPDAQHPLPKVTGNYGCATAFGGVFALAGLAMLVWITLLPAWRVRHAASWPSVPGTVLDSRLGTHHDNDDNHTTYRVEVHYRYAVAGRTYEGTTYDASGGTYTPYHDTDAAIVARLRPGSAVTVYYDPADPARALLNREMPPGSVAFVWFPFLFIGAGVAVVWATLRAPRATTAPSTPPVQTTLVSRRWPAFVFILLFTTMWCGVTTFMFFHGVPVWFGSIFAAFGLFTLFLTGYVGLGLLNPRVALTFAGLPLRPGERTDVTYRVDGDYARLSRLAFTLEHRETVRVSTGSDSTTTHTKVLRSVELFETTKPVDFAAGRFVLTMPADATPTDYTPARQLRWYVACRGSVARRPDVKDDFEVPVPPADPTAG